MLFECPEFAAGQNNPIIPPLSYLSCRSKNQTHEMSQNQYCLSAIGDWRIPGL